MRSAAALVDSWPQYRKRTASTTASSLHVAGRNLGPQDPGQFTRHLYQKIGFVCTDRFSNDPSYGTVGVVWTRQDEITTGNL
jgi:hypothetical protein